jgi:hypothetical protein
VAQKIKNLNERKKERKLKEKNPRKDKKFIS